MNRREEERQAAQSEAASAFRPSHPEASCWLVYTQPEPRRAEPSRAQPRPPPCPRCSLHWSATSPGFSVVILRLYTGGAPCAPANPVTLGAS